MESFNGIAYDSANLGRLFLLLLLAVSTPRARPECFVDQDGAQFIEVELGVRNQRLYRCGPNDTPQRFWASSIHVTDMPHHNRTFVRRDGETNEELAGRICE